VWQTWDLDLIKYLKWREKERELPLRIHFETNGLIFAMCHLSLSIYIKLGNYFRKHDLAKNVMQAKRERDAIVKS
jgi:hypothetical protein